MLEPQLPNESPRDRAFRRSQRLFELADAALANSGEASPQWLGDPRIASVVQEAIHFWEGERYELHRYVVMPNHVHLLFRPLPVTQAGKPAPLEADTRTDDEPSPGCSMATIMKGLKGYTAREANRILGRSGTFWQDESWDRWIRDEDDYLRTVHYIDQNPVAAGLCQSPENWPWSSAGESGAQAFQPVSGTRPEVCESQPEEP